MSPATIASPAWLTVPPADGLPDEVATEIGPVAKKIGFVPSVARPLAISPDHFTGWWRYLEELMRGPPGLTKTQPEMIALVISVISAQARCPTARPRMAPRRSCASTIPYWLTGSRSATATSSCHPGPGDAGLRRQAPLHP